MVRDFGEVIDNLHLKDFDQGEWRLLGRGTLDFDAMFAALSDTGYDGWLCVDEETSASLSEAMRASWEFLRAPGRA
jgi:sugar phosphate isomerase/epimerase